jgi:hypothetical protein
LTCTFDRASLPVSSASCCFSLSTISPAETELQSDSGNTVSAPTNLRVVQGGSQAIVDARILGAAMVEHGVTEKALAAYDDQLCGPISQLILRNRGAGPFGLLNIVDERCGGTFNNIDDVIPSQERAAFMAGYRAAAGFAVEKLQ